MQLSKLTYNVLDRLFASATSALFLGKAGVGKTQLLTQYAQARKMGLVVFHATSVDSPDIRGFAVPHKNPDGTAVTKFTLPPILEMIARTGKDKGILFLDELLQADHLVQKALAPAMSERMVGEHELPEGWVVWSASNRTVDKAGVNRLLGHITNRLTIVEVESDVDGWIRWATTHEIHPMYLAFAKARPGIVFDNDAPKNPDQPYCTPRSFTNACRFHTLGDHDTMTLKNDEVMQTFVSGFVGQGAAAEMFAFFKVAEELPTLQEILDDPHNCKLPSEYRLDAQYAAVQLAIHHANTENIEELLAFVCRLNKEMQVSALFQINAKTASGLLLNSPALTKWISENKALIVSSMTNFNEV